MCAGGDEGSFGGVKASSLEVDEDMFEGAGWTDLVEMCRSVPAKGEGDAVCTIWVRCRGAWGARTTPTVNIIQKIKDHVNELPC